MEFHERVEPIRAIRHEFNVVFLSIDAGKIGDDHHHHAHLHGCKVKPGCTPRTIHITDRLFNSRSRAALGGTNCCSRGLPGLYCVACRARARRVSARNNETCNLGRGLKDNVTCGTISIENILKTMRISNKLI